MKRTTGQSMKPIETIPLFETGTHDMVVAWRNDRPITRAALLRDAGKLAEGLPDRRWIANCCMDRYNFLVGFTAALMLGQPSLLPNDLTKKVLTSLGQYYEEFLCLSDHPLDDDRLEVRDIRFDGLSTGVIPAVPAPLANRTAAIVFSSGSTGEPMPTERTWKWLVAGARLYAETLGLTQHAGFNIVATVASQHAFGLEGAIMLPLRYGSAVHAKTLLFPEDIAAALGCVPAPRVLLTTPLHLRTIIESRLKMPHTAVVVSATAPLPIELAARTESLFGAAVMEVYGCTEIGLIATRRTVEGEAWHLPRGLKLRVDEASASVEAPYIGTAVELSDTLEPLSDDTFLLHGRGADVVKIAGNRTSLSGLNTILTGISGVVDGTFFVPPGEEATRVRRLTAFVVAPERNAKEILHELRQNIASVFLPRPLVLVSEIPRSVSGKVLFADLLALNRHASGNE